jgi:hypothetical protein
MTGLPHDIGRATCNAGKLLAEQDEDDTARAELDRFPHDAAANARLGERASALFDIAHRHAGRDGSQDTGGAGEIGEGNRRRTGSAG